MQRWLTSWKRHNSASRSKNKLILGMYIFIVWSLYLNQQVFAQRKQNGKYDCFLISVSSIWKLNIQASVDLKALSSSVTWVLELRNNTQPCIHIRRVFESFGLTFKRNTAVYFFLRKHFISCMREERKAVYRWWKSSAKALIRLTHF